MRGQGRLAKHDRVHERELVSVPLLLGRLVVLQRQLESDLVFGRINLQPLGRIE